MRRPAVRFLLTLVIATSILGVVPATSEAGIIPWAWDTLFGPVGSIEARRVARYGGYGGGCCGPVAPVYTGFRGRWSGYSAGYSNGCCAPACNSCGVACATSGCSTCGTGYGGGYYDGGYSSCGAGGCANGQCNVNYPPGTTGSSPVTPAPAPAGGPSPGYDNRSAPPAPPPATNDNFVPPVTPPPAPGAANTDGFTPAAPRTPAPNTVDPTNDNYVPPKVAPPGAATTDGVDADGTGTPPVVPPKKPKITDEDDKGTSIGPRFELNEKVTWRPSIQRTRTALSAVRVSANANRYGIFAKTAWRSGTDTELAKK